MTPLLSCCNSNKKHSLSSRSKLAFDFQQEPLVEFAYVFVLHKWMDTSRVCCCGQCSEIDTRRRYFRCCLCVRWDRGYVENIKKKCDWKNNSTICTRNKHLNWINERIKRRKEEKKTFTNIQKSMIWHSWTSETIRQAKLLLYYTQQMYSTYSLTSI